MKLSVVIPCYNERSTIEAVVGAVRSAPVQDVEIIIVDDGSTDGTRELLEGKPPGWVDKIVLQERNFGKGAALRAGFQAATWSTNRASIPSFLHRFWKIVRMSCLVPGSWVAGRIGWFTSGIWWGTNFLRCCPTCLQTSTSLTWRHVTKCFGANSWTALPLKRTGLGLNPRLSQR